MSSDPQSLFVTGRCRLVRLEQQSRTARRTQALVSRHSLSFEDAITNVTSGIRSLASDVHAAELERAVRRQDGASITHWAALCATTEGGLDCRSGAHSVKGGIFALSAPPLWLAAYRGDHVLVELLLRHSASPDCISEACGGRHCGVGGTSALHSAVARGLIDSAQRLLSLKASPDAAMCFGLATEEDEPEWNEESGKFEGGLVGLTVLQLAALRSKEPSLCSALLAYGADAAKLHTLPAEVVRSSSSELAPLLKPLSGEDGEDLDCPICLSAVLQLNAEWTPCCVKAFHSHCLRGLTSCPMCRTKLDRGGGHAHGGGAGSHNVSSERASAQPASGELVPPRYHY